jgi:hypothetical protein
MRGHREQVAEEVRHNVREEGPRNDTASVAPDPGTGGGAQPTGKTQAAANREEDPPA